MVHEAQEPCALSYTPETFAQLDQRLSRLEEQCVEALQAQGFPRSQISTESFLHLRYQGTDCALMVSAHQHPATACSPRAGDFGAAFVERYLCPSMSLACGLLVWLLGPHCSLGWVGAGT